MRVPVPKNKLVAFTLVGALLTAGVAGALALPGGGLAQAGEQPDSPDTTGPDTSRQVGDDAPTPNQEFTPAVQTPSGYEDDEHDEEHEEHDEDDEHEDEADHEDDEHEDEDEEGDEEGDEEE